ncbi:DPP IV N-terminal domain-containing protein [Pseudohaliea sp.]|uniref:S9 family peptidase n=1 Tax=Pseudohaliea sp. TaxID=2740289 RepID=UPI0032EE9AE7
MKPESYEWAFEVWPTQLAGLVANSQVQPNWLGDEGNRFWYLDRSHGQKRFLLCDPDSASVTPAFDHEKLASILSDLLSIDVAAEDLPFDDISLKGPPATVSFTVNGYVYCYTDGGDTVELLTSAAPELPSPDGTLSVFLEGYDLWMRGESGEPTRITSDGCDERRYGALPDHDRLAIYRARGLLPKFPPLGVFWSPDSRFLLCARIDQSEVEPYPFMESVPYDGSLRPRVHNVRLPLAGDPGRVRQDYVLVDLRSDDPQISELQFPEGWGSLEINALTTGFTIWRDDATELFVLAANRNAQRRALVAISPESARVSIVHEESTSTFSEFGSFEYHAPSVAVLPDRNQAIWYSQSTGEGHLYLLDLDNAAPPAPLTKGDWRVLDLLYVDRQRQKVWFAASGLDPDEYPYNRHLCCVDLDRQEPNSGFEQLTEAGFDHALAGQGLHLMKVLAGLRTPSMLSPDGSYFVDNASSREAATRTTLRRSDGSAVLDLCSADTSALESIGWRPPEPFEVVLPGLRESIHGVMVLPRNFDQSLSYPVIERIYAGPQIVAQPRNFHEVLNGAFVYGAYTLADMGFVVVLMDGPGTPLRSKPFQDQPYGEADRLGVCYHAAVLHELAKSRSWMDMDRVGVNGHSWGGHASAMAMLLCPDTYHVGVSSAGIYDPAAFFTDAAERYIGSPDYGDGRRERRHPDEQPPNYIKMSPSSYAEALRGQLLLAYGDLDENALPSSLLRFYASLQRAGKAPDLLFLPGRSHALFAEPFFQKQLIDYFLRHLRGLDPDVHLPINAKPGPRPLI